MEDTTTNLQEIMLEPQASPGDSTYTCEVCRGMCGICMGIWACFLDQTTSREVTLGYVDDPLPPSCPGHSPLLIHCRDHRLAGFPFGLLGAIDSGDKKDSNRTGNSADGANTAAEGELPAIETNKVTVRTMESSQMVMLARDISEDIVAEQQLIMLKRNQIPGHPGIGIRLDPDWIDLELAREWKRKCLEEHGMECNNSYKISPVRPDWVVDVESGCIVPGQDCPAFVALSYRWGGHSWPRVDREMLRAMGQPGALATACLAPIIRHAMSLTSAIGERYLWVDALCIVQGDSAETAHQLNLMGAFYASAVVTIVVADGDAAVGIPGIKGVSDSRKTKQTLIPFGEETLMCPTFAIHLGDYKKRGWTYQEYIMSQRRLIFAGDRMQWECQCCSWHEEVVLGSKIDQETSSKENGATLILRGFPDINSLRRLMSDYNSRSFTYEEDVIPGVSGLLSLFSRSFQGGFLCGLPEMFFDKALGWCASDNLRRRRPSGRPKKDQLAHSLETLPSWSWVGWEGKIYHDVMDPEEVIEAGYWTYHHEPVEETIPITSWFTSDCAQGGVLRNINPTWFQNRDARYKDFARPLSDGWSRRDTIPPSAQGPGFWCPPGCSDYFFQHRLFPERHWYFPFPIMEVQELTPQSMPKQTPYLFCKTYKTQLWAVCSVRLWEDMAKNTPFYNAGLPFVKNIRILEIRIERGGPKVGELYLHNSDQLVPFLLASGDSIKTGPGQFVELVAIYRSVVRESTYCHPGIVSERYRVLWVEWENGIAYRLGVGWVERAAWEGANRTEIDLVLG